jgi:hypothetical protein
MKWAFSTFPAQLTCYLNYFHSASMLYQSDHECVASYSLSSSLTTSLLTTYYSK